MKTRWLATVVVGVAVAGLAPFAARASCIPQTPEEQLRRADVVVEAVALEGPTALGVQRFRTSRYLKGSGPDLIRVTTGVIVRPDGTGETTSNSLDVQAGDRWRIYASRERGDVLETSACAGSKLLASADRSRSVSPAPVQEEEERDGDGGWAVVVLTFAAILAAAVGVVTIARIRRRARD